MRVLVLLASILVAGTAWAGQAGRASRAGVEAAQAPANDDCLTCHSDETATRANGTSVAVKPEVFGKSIHGGLSCTDCHTDLARAEVPHPEKLQKVSCATCHADTVAVVEQSIHYAPEKNGQGAHCVNCHGTHDILPSKDMASRTYALNLPKTCAQCHSHQHLPGAAGTVADSYIDSVHGRGVARAGLVVSANCTSCHGAHDIKTKTDPASRVNRTRIADTCGTCHQGIEPLFATSVHAEQSRMGNTGAAVCSDCHTSHQIQRADTDQWRLAAIQECGSCHLDKVATYRDTFHGQVTALGFTRMATCSDCHGSHTVMAAGNPASSIHQGNLVKTCGACHQGSNANFVKYDPHADKHDAKRNPELYWSYKFMQVLLGGVFLFFGVHTLMWYPRAFRARREREANKGAPS